MAHDHIKIRLESYDHEALDVSAQEIVDVARRSEAQVTGPVPLPTRVERF
ncbi:MAG TPA: 30S ribosomal protein S10, partial [Planctomycetota bacterium]|nr:30S ribosomal protein S10 [Planctomycetota bacterium]